MISFVAGARSEIGPVRSTNQDSVYVSRTSAIVADGVGGGPSGDIASAVVVHRLSALMAGMSADRLTTEMSQLVHLANADVALHARRRPELAGMATTFTGLFSIEGGVLVSHIGDSRAYLFRNGHLTQVTRDRSFVQALVDNGVITAEEAMRHPARNVILHSLHGEASDDDELNVFAIHHQTGDRWIVASDGLTDYVDEASIRIALGASDPHRAADLLVAAAYRAPTRDNVSVVVADAVSTVEANTEARPASFLGAAAEYFNEAELSSFRV